jgi:hypothetical protein
MKTDSSDMGPALLQERRRRTRRGPAAAAGNQGPVQSTNLALAYTTAPTLPLTVTGAGSPAGALYMPISFKKHVFIQMQ